MYISLMTNDAELLFMCSWAIIVYLLWRSLLKSSVHFIRNYLSSCYRLANFLTGKQLKLLFGIDYFQNQKL